MKRAIVLGGGGSKGSYEVGVWQALLEMGLDWQIVTGASVGALNGAMMALGRFEEACRMWDSLTTADIVEVSPAVHRPAALLEALRRSETLRGLFDGYLRDAVEQHMDPRPLQELLQSYVPEEALRACPVAFGLSAVEYPSLRPAFLEMGQMPPGTLHEYLLASATVFPSMKAREIDGIKYIDGGFGDNLPVNMALDMGAREVIAVDLQAVGVVRPYKTEVPVRTIRCHWNLGPLMEFDPAMAARNRVLGYHDARRSFGLCEGWAYTFPNGTARRMRERLGPFFRKVLEGAHFVVGRSTPALEAQLHGRMIRSLAEARGIRQSHAERDLPLAAAEAAGELLGLDPCREYGGVEFEEALLEKYRPLAELSQGTLEKILFAAGSPQQKLEALGKVDRPQLVAYIVSRVGVFLHDGVLPPDSRLLCTLAPQEFFAGLYVSALLAEHSDEFGKEKALP